MDTNILDSGDQKYFVLLRQVYKICTIQSLEILDDIYFEVWFSFPHFCKLSNKQHLFLWFFYINFVQSYLLLILYLYGCQDYKTQKSIFSPKMFRLYEVKDFQWCISHHFLHANTKNIVKYIEIESSQWGNRNHIFLLYSLELNSPLLSIFRCKSRYKADPTVSMVFFRKSHSMRS